jgi:hypothetical protein
MREREAAMPIVTAKMGSPSLVERGKLIIMLDKGLVLGGKEGLLGRLLETLGNWRAFPAGFC